MNPMLKGLNQSQMTNNITPFRNMFKMLKSAGNPKMLLNQMAGQNPQLKQVMQYVNENGGDAKQAFYKLAEERGVNPEEILRQLNG